MTPITRRTVLTVAGSVAAAATVSTAIAQGAPSPAPAIPGMEFVLEAIVDIAPLEDLGDGPLGRRRIVPITGGSFEGPAIRGKVRAGGADRQLIRADGVRQLSALYELETDDGAVITILNKVLIDEQPGKPRYAFSTPEVAAPKGRYDWLNRAVFVGTLSSLKPARQAVRIRLYKVV